MNTFELRQQSLARGARLALWPALVVVFVLSVLQFEQPLTVEFGDKIEHALAYFALAGLAGTGYADSPRRRAMMTGLLGYGLLIECVQGLLPWREFSLLDALANGAGIALWLLLARWRGARPA